MHTSSSYFNIQEVSAFLFARKHSQWAGYSIPPFLIQTQFSVIYHDITTLIIGTYSGSLQTCHA